MYACGDKRQRSEIEELLQVRSIHLLVDLSCHHQPPGVFLLPFASLSSHYPLPLTLSCECTSPYFICVWAVGVFVQQFKPQSFISARKRIF